MTQRGAFGATPPTKKKSPARGFMCGCGGSKSVSRAAVAAANISAAATTTPMKNTATASTAKRTIAVKTKVMQDAREEDEVEGASAEGTPSADALLQELRELEQGVRELGVREQDDAGGGANGNAPRTRPRHRRSATDWGGGGRLEAESVAVVTESADPLGDFRRSMVQMILENGITGGVELRELLQRFLSLNSPRHHHLILRAFADVWEEIFAGGGSLVLRQ
jgi:uncharacterized protein (TIGR01568 family)